MSVYPIRVCKTTLGVTQGSSDKQYHVLVVVNSEDHGLIINRYGKRGAWGKLIIEKYTDGVVATLEGKKKINEKVRSRGYRVENDIAHTCNNSRELIDILGPQYFYNLGSDALRWLDPDISVDGVKPPESLSPSYYQDKNGRWVPDTPPPRVPTPTPEQLVEQNPMWGLF